MESAEIFFKHRGWGDVFLSRGSWRGETPKPQGLGFFVSPPPKKIIISWEPKGTLPVPPPPPQEIAGLIKGNQWLIVPRWFQTFFIFIPIWGRFQF